MFHDQHLLSENNKKVSKDTSMVENKSRTNNPYLKKVEHRICGIDILKHQTIDENPSLTFSLGNIYIVRIHCDQYFISKN